LPSINTSTHLAVDSALAIAAGEYRSLFVAMEVIEIADEEQVNETIPEEPNEAAQEPKISNAVLVELFFKKDPNKPDGFSCGNMILQKRLKGFTNLIAHIKGYHEDWKTIARDALRKNQTSLRK
jgi:hypothetical protein